MEVNTYSKLLLTILRSDQEAESQFKHSMGNRTTGQNGYTPWSSNKKTHLKLEPWPADPSATILSPVVGGGGESNPPTPHPGKGEREREREIKHPPSKKETVMPPTPPPKRRKRAWVRRLRKGPIILIMYSFMGYFSNYSTQPMTKQRTKTQSKWTSASTALSKEKEILPWLWQHMLFLLQITGHCDGHSLTDSLEKQEKQTFNLH